jgi:hypothetical protein
MPKAQPQIRLVFTLRRAFVVGLVENDLQSALELTRTLTVPFPSVLARAPDCRRAER